MLRVEKAMLCRVIFLAHLVLLQLVCNCSKLSHGTYHEIEVNSNTSQIALHPVDGGGGEHPCKRTCVPGISLRCDYHFSVEWYYTMGKACYNCPRNREDCFRPDCVLADGKARSVLVVNRSLPGPTIELCQNDEVRIAVANELFGETTTIHWHGQHQEGTPYMDGVPGVTQCPISPETTFTYKFTARNAGTHFWHSHTGLQRGDGAFGAFIVHVPKEQDPHESLYDFDLSAHVISIADWDVATATDVFLAHYHYGGSDKPAKLLVNGLGMRNFTHLEDNTPIARFHVQRGYRYRFRLINAGFLNCPIELSFDNHSMLIISTDGEDVEPIEVQSLVSYAGERFDFILNAQQPNERYWIRFRGLMNCDERFKKAHQVAVLDYTTDFNSAELPQEAVPKYETSQPSGLQMNPLNKGVESSLDETTIIIPALRAVRESSFNVSATPDAQFFIAYDFYQIDNPMYHTKGKYGFNQVAKDKRVLTPQLNHIAFALQPIPLLQGRRQLHDFCNETTEAHRNCETNFCKCTHVIQVKLNSLVELILVDAGVAYDANHPFHMHGHSFAVVGMERLASNVTVEEVKLLDKQGMLRRNFERPPVKDTVTIPDGGYTIVRFNASNPGYWLFHCHLDFHLEVGMGLVFKFGENDEMPPVPAHFPQCGSYPSTASAHNLQLAVLILNAVVIVKV